MPVGGQILAQVSRHCVAIFKLLVPPTLDGDIQLPNELPPDLSAMGYFLNRGSALFQQHLTSALDGVGAGGHGRTAVPLNTRLRHAVNTSLDRLKVRHSVV